MIYWILSAVVLVIIPLGLYYIGKLYGGTATISFNTLTSEDKVIAKSAFVNYLLWAAVQQAIVIGVFLLLKLTPLPVASIILICGLLFSACHTPNILLNFATLAMEPFLLICFASIGWWFIPMMALTHSVLATCLLYFFPTSITHNFTILIWFK